MGRHIEERLYSTALYLVSKNPDRYERVPDEIKELFQKAGHVYNGEVTDEGLRFLRFIKSRINPRAKKNKQVSGTVKLSENMMKREIGRAHV